MFCNKCGCELTTDSEFCNKCGAPVERFADEPEMTLEESIALVEKFQKELAQLESDKREIKNNEDFCKIDFRTNVRPSSLKMSPYYKGINWDKEIENRKSSVRCKVEHPFLIVKRQFGYAKVVYRGIYKNMNRFHILFASANLVKCFRAGRTEEFCMA